ncbi:MAG: ABC transporter permease [Roseburia sp.]|nr:ABC transporter permease [Roseburia sp.]
MEILTLLKANIRRKKGSFVSVILLTLIIAMSVTIILSIKESTFKGVNYAHEICDTPDICAIYTEYNFSDHMIESIKKDDKVERVNTADAILTEKASMGTSMDADESIISLTLILRSDGNTKLLNENLNGITENTPKLQKGEIYVSQGFLTNVYGNVGEKVTVETIAGEYEFTVKGILLDPMLGCSLISYNTFCISDEDFSEIALAVSKGKAEQGYGLGKYVQIYKSDSCALTNGELRRQLNLDGITDRAVNTTTKDTQINLTLLFPEVIASILLVFVMSLLIIVIIVTVHNISAEIETNYVTFGILKAQGFNKNKIRLLFLGQYLSAELIGAAIGTALSIPLIGTVSNIFVTIIAVPVIVSVPAGSIALILTALFALSVISVFFVTIKINKISPVRAISGAKNEIYFDSRINAPISGRFLSVSLAFRQFTSAAHRYVGTFVIVTILVFFMTTVTILANALNSKSALESMGMGAVVSEIDVEPKKKLSDHDVENIEKEIERFSEIRKVYYFNATYFSVFGEEMLCMVYKDPSVLPALKGRAPIYDNEIGISPILLDEFNLKIGDEVTVGRQGKKEKYIITGVIMSVSDAGRSFPMSYAAAERIGYDDWLRGSYSLESGNDEILNKKIVDALNEKFGNLIKAEVADGFLDANIKAAVEAVRIIIYVFSVLFSLIVVHMVCSKAFTQERTDIGIYKAVGFKTPELQSQFALRFLIVSVIGSAAGGILSYFFSGKVLGILLTSIGITSFNTDVAFSSFVIPILIVCLSFLTFSYLVSGKIRKVKIRELVTE